jgi:hypothetical protein
MPCFQPIRVATRRLAPAWHPQKYLTIPDQEVGCGRCPGCRRMQAREWATRLTHEARVTTPAFFITLTYDDQHIPHTGTLDPEDLRLFWRRLRRNYPKGSVSYYGVGEYGGETFRPHYHAAIFGAQLPDRAAHRGSGSSSAWRSGLLEDTWKFGHSEFSALNWASAAYVAGYVLKKNARLDEDPDRYLRVDPETGELHKVTREFSRMSLRPPLGLRWLQRFWRDVYPSDRVVIQGQEWPVPRYYDRAFTAHSPQDPSVPKYDFPGITFPERLELLAEVKLKRIENAPEYSPDDLAAKRRIHERRTALFSPRNKI